MLALLGCGHTDEQVRSCPERARCNGDFCEQVLIGAGVFLMGTEEAPRADSHFPSGDARPAHPVQLDAYCIDQYEVSLERYEQCVVAGACSPDGLLYTKSDYQTVVNHYPSQCAADLSACRHYAVNAKSYDHAKA